jgi:hypothetical protein
MIELRRETTWKRRPAEAAVPGTNGSRCSSGE